MLYNYNHSIFTIILYYIIVYVELWDINWRFKDMYNMIYYENRTQTNIGTQYITHKVLN